MGLKERLAAIAPQGESAPVGVTETGIYETHVEEATGDQKAFMQAASKEHTCFMPVFEDRSLAGRLKTISDDATSLLNHELESVRSNAAFLLMKIEELQRLVVREMLVPACEWCLCIGEDYEKLLVLTVEHRAAIGLKQIRNNQKKAREAAEKASAKAADWSESVAAEEAAGKSFNEGCKVVAGIIGYDESAVRKAVKKYRDRKARGVS